MKTPLTLSLFLALSFFSVGQENRVQEILSLKEQKILSYDPEMNGGTTLLLKMGFASSTILNPAKIKILKDATVLSIDIVYSDYPKGDEYTKLNQNRIENLIKLNSSLLAKKDIIWRMVRQMDCTDEVSARELFHGIVITYRPAQTKDLAMSEIDYLRSLIKKPSTSGKGDYFFLELNAVDSSTGKLSAVTRTDTVFSGGSKKSGSSPADFYVRDSVVGVVLKRNKWTEMAIVADLTGSMSPYTAQLLLWFKLNTLNSPVKQFVFFNDGDMTPDNQKVIGKTGGIYATRSSKFDEVENLAFKTMRNGGGGDIPENNIEAILKANQLCNECKNVVMIADNMAPVKDIVLLSQVKTPVKIILCGAVYGINPVYLDIARATGGSVHTMEKDLTDLVKMKEGEEIKIGNQKFIIINGKFTRVVKS